MPIMYTCILRIKDWKAFRTLNQKVLVGQFSRVGALRYRVYRNRNDASQALLAAELPDHDALRDLHDALNQHIDMLNEASLFDEYTWETMGWEGIE
ncbi:MAG: hypothetical protein ACYDBJ_05155 [Aggregatilineales bacterium]